MTRELNDLRQAAASGTARSLVVLLHGYGADGADLFGLAEPLTTVLPDTVFRAPDAPERCAASGFGCQWFPIPHFDGSSEAEAQAGVAAATADLDAYLDRVLEEEGLSPARLCLFGFSQGAMMSLQVGPLRVPRIGGIVACSGRLLDPQAAAMAPSRPPVLLMHGDRDEVVPFAEMQDAGQALVAADYTVYGHVMQGSGHGIAQDGLSVAASFLVEILGD